MLGQEWRLQAACRDRDPALFFPNSGRDARAALRICATCPVQEECAADAKDSGAAWGVWAGRIWSDGRPHKRNDGTATPYPPAQRTEAVELYRQLRSEHHSDRATIDTVAKQLGINTYSIRSWVNEILGHEARGAGQYAEYLAKRRAEGLAMLHDIRSRYATNAEAMQAVADTLSVAAETVRTWANQARRQQQNTVGRAA